MKTKESQFLSLRVAELCKQQYAAGHVIIINKGWATRERGYLCSVTETGVFVRQYYHDNTGEQHFVPFEDIITLTGRATNSSFFDRFDPYKH